jgi:hypothetical protein
MDRVAADGRIPIPTLDDRRYQDLVDQAMRLRDQRCPEWTSQEPGDPGVALIEIFAFMIDQLLYRLNQIPDRLYSSFLNMVGVRCRTGEVAETRVDFFLSAKPENPIRIPRGTRIATVATENSEPIEFSTVEEAVVQPAELRWLGTASTIAEGARSATGDHIVFGFPTGGPNSLISIELDLQVPGVLRHWQAWRADGWVSVAVEERVLDTGRISVLADTGEWVPTEVAGAPGYWLRLEVSPQTTVTVAKAFCVGVAVTAWHASPVTGERLGVSDGRPRQRFRTARAPVLADRHRILVGGEEWRAVDSLVDSGPDDEQVELDTVNGEILFGDGAHGAIPSEGAEIVADYLTGGGTAGNVAAHTLTVLRTAIPGISRVDNRFAAVGGVNAEPVEEARRRAPALLRSGWRAVSTDDYERLAMQASPAVARARCVPDPDGRPVVRVLLVPYVADDQSLESMGPASVVFEQVLEYLAQRRVVGMGLLLEAPSYTLVSVVASVTAIRHARQEDVAQRAQAALRTYLHPVTGGRDGQGWPFGRRLVAGELYGVLLDVPGVDVVDSLEIFAGDPAQPADRIELPPDGLLWPERTQVRVIMP